MVGGSTAVSPPTGGAVVDLNNDGWPDLVLDRYRPIRPLGRGEFQEAVKIAREEGLRRLARE